MVNSTTSSMFAQLANQIPTGSAKNSAESASEEFAHALRSLLEGAGRDTGLPADSFQVDVRETTGDGEDPSVTGRQFLITILPEGDGAPESEVVEPPAAPLGTWQEMLARDLTQKVLRGVSDSAALLNERLASVQGASNASITNAFNESSQALNPSWLSNRDQADAMMGKLQSLGAPASEVEELQMSGGPFGIDYADERRSFLINGMNVQMLMERYAKYPVEVADQMTLDELKTMAA